MTQLFCSLTGIQLRIIAFVRLKYRGDQLGHYRLFFCFDCCQSLEVSKKQTSQVCLQEASFSRGSWKQGDSALKGMNRDINMQNNLKHLRRLINPIRNGAMCVNNSNYTSASNATTTESSNSQCAPSYGGVIKCRASRIQSLRDGRVGWRCVNCIFLHTQRHFHF